MYILYLHIAQPKAKQNSNSKIVCWLIFQIHEQSSHIAANVEILKVSVNFLPCIYYVYIGSGTPFVCCQK